MRIEDEIKLTFDDVLIRPKRSTLISRSEVKLEREFKFRHNKHTWEGIDPKAGRNPFSKPQTNFLV